MVSQTEKIQFLEHHLKYAIGSFLQCKTQLEEPDITKQTTFLMAFCVQARILKVFVRSTDGNNNMRATDYVDNYKQAINDHMTTLFSRVDLQIFHLGKKRDENQLTYGQVDEIYDWVVDALKTFRKALDGSPYAEAWDRSIPGQPIHISTNPSAYACTASSTTSGVSSPSPSQPGGVIIYKT